jgi:hypothetical protein
VCFPGLTEAGIVRCLPLNEPPLDALAVATFVPSTLRSTDSPPVKCAPFAVSVAPAGAEVGETLRVATVAARARVGTAANATRTRAARAQRILRMTSA